MLVSARLVRAFVVSTLLCGLSACGAPKSHLRHSQHRAMQLVQQNSQLAAANSQLQSERTALEQQLAALSRDRQSLEQRLANLHGEREELQKRYMNLVNLQKQQGSPLSPGTTDRLNDLAEKYPGFEFDPDTGVSKFHSDLLFASGSDEVREAAIPLLQDFAKILNEGDARDLNILVVGHTDDRRVAKPATRQKHQDNWGLSVHRAANVTRSLSSMGIKGSRMGAAGYGEYQPLVPNTDDKNRARNRRVEIFVLAPNASIAGWDTDPPR